MLQGVSVRTRVFAFVGTCIYGSSFGLYFVGQRRSAIATVLFTVTRRGL